jgi:ATP-binding cassette subfamily B protein
MTRPDSLRSSIPSLRRILVRFWPQVRRERGLVAAGFLGLAVEIAFRLIEPWPIKFVLDEVIVSQIAGEQSGAGWAERLDPSTLLIVCAVAVVVVAILRAVGTYTSRVMFALVGNKVLTRSRAELFAHLQRLCLSFHHRRRTGDLITRVTSDIGRLKEVVVTALLPLVAHSITLVGMLIIMLVMDWRLALAALVILPLSIASTHRFSGRIRKVARKQRKREGEIGATAAEAIGSIKVIQSLSLEEVQQQTFTAQNRASLKEGVKAKRLSARLVGTVDVLIAIGTAFVLWFGAGLVVRGELTLGELIVFLAYLKNAFKPMRDLAKYSSRIAAGAASAERVVELLDIAPSIENRPGARELAGPVTAIRYEDITFGYDPEHVAVDGLSLEATPGRVIALAGSSGAGKSTVLSLLLRFYDPASGRITWNDRDARDYTYESLRRAIAVVPQENVLFAVSVRDNIAYGSIGAADDEIIAAAKLARAHDFIVDLPNGYDTILGERGETISEGQRQRISIARAAIRKAPVLIREALRDLRRDRITFIIAHDLSTVEEADEIIYLERGRVIERGSHDELIALGGQYAAMHGLQRGAAVESDIGSTTHALRR